MSDSHKVVECAVGEVGCGVVVVGHGVRRAAEHLEHDLEARDEQRPAAELDPVFAEELTDCVHLQF